MDALCGRIMKGFLALRPKVCSYLVDMRVKGTKRCSIKRAVAFADFKICPENNRTILRTQQRFRIETQNVFTEKVDKIALSANDYKRIQTPNGVTTYPYGYGSSGESLEHTKIKI